MTGGSTRKAHPTALAFYRSLEKKEHQDESCAEKKSSLVERMATSVGWRSRYSASTHYPFTIHGKSLQVCQVLESKKNDDEYGTGAFVWPASMVLVKYLENKMSDAARGKVVVDLGAGTGITSIAAAMLGASTVICTDGNEAVVKLAQANVNQADAAVRNVNKDAKMFVTKYLWGQPKSVLPLNEEKKNSTSTVIVDTILVSDCILPKLFPMDALLDAIDLLSGDDDHTETLLSYEHRYYPHFDPKVKFIAMAEERGFVVEVVPREQQDEVYSVDDIEIWKMRRRRQS